jgi:hypothetical protein
MKIDKPIRVKDILNQGDVNRLKTTPYITAQNSPDSIFETP